MPTLRHVRFICGHPRPFYLIAFPGRGSLIAYAVRILVDTSQDQHVMRLLWKEASRFSGNNFSIWSQKAELKMCVPCQRRKCHGSRLNQSLRALPQSIKGIVKEEEEKKKVLNLRDSTRRGLFQCQRSSASGRWCLYNSKDTSVATSRWQDAHVALYFAQTQGRAVRLCLHYLQGYQSMCWGDLSAAHHQSQAPLPVPPERAVASLWSFDRPLISLHLPGLGNICPTGKQPGGKILHKSLPLDSRPASSSQPPRGRHRGTTDERCKTLAVQASFRHLAWPVASDGALVGGWRAIKIHLHFKFK